MIHWEALFYNILYWEPICYKNRAFFLLFFYIELRLHKLGTSEANLTTLEVDEIILAMREIALQFSQIAQRLYPHQIRESTLEMIQSPIQQNIDFLTKT